MKNKETQGSIDSADNATEGLLVNPNLGDEADYAADGLDRADKEKYVIEKDDHYAG